MKCQFASKSSSVDGPRYTVSTSFGGVAVLSETLIHNNDIEFFRVFVPKKSSFEVVGYWMTLWQENNSEDYSCTVTGRKDYHTVITVLHRKDWSATKKFEWLFDRMMNFSDLEPIITGRL